MILDEIRVENWRNYRGEYTFSFKEGINLVVGPNGSGKTTLFEVLWRTFFDRHNTTSHDMQEIRPVGTSLSPRSSIIFRQGGKRYKIEKQFLDHQYAKLYEWGSDGFSLLDEQDRADSAISELFSGTLTGRGPTDPRNRGLAEALWYIQKDRSLPDGKWNEGLQRGFGGIIDIAVESPEERRILDLIGRDYSENLTESKGEPRKNTELYRVTEDLDSKRRELSEAQSKLHSADSLRERLEQLISEETEKNSALIEAKANKKRSDEEIKEAESFERNKIKVKAEYDNGTQKVKELADKVKQIQARNQAITDLRKNMTDWNSQFLDRQMKSSLARGEKDALEAKWQSEFQPRLKVVESQLEALETLEKINSLNKEKGKLEKFLDKRRSKEEELNANRKTLEDFIAPSEKELEGFRQLSEESIKVEGKLSVNSIRVGFHLKRGISVVPDGEISKDKGEFVVTEPTTFTIKRIGKVRIRGGIESLRDLNESKDKLSRSLSIMLKKYSVKDEMSLTRLLTQKNSYEQGIKAIKKELSNLMKEQPDAENDLARVKRDMITTERKIRELQFPSIGSDDIANQIEVLSKEKRELIRQIADAQSKEKKAFQKYEEENLKSGEVRSNIDGATARISTLEDENAKVITMFGSMHGLEIALQEAIRIQTEINRELLSIDALFDEKVSLPRKRAEIIDRALEQISDRMSQVGNEIAGLKGMIEQIAVDGLYTKVGDLEIEIERLESRKVVLERRANARRLLREIIDMFKTQRTSTIGAPIRKYVDPWLKQLSGGAFDSLSIDEALQPDFAVLSDKVNKISLKSLSYGTAEQVVVLVRLAIAAILSQREKNLVVLDDRLVNADPVRLQMMLSIIDEVSERCQIVISTCEDARYLGLSANVIRLPNGHKVES